LSASANSPPSTFLVSPTTRAPFATTGFLSRVVAVARDPRRPAERGETVERHDVSADLAANRRVAAERHDVALDVAADQDVAVCDDNAPGTVSSRSTSPEPDSTILSSGVSSAASGGGRKQCAKRDKSDEKASHGRRAYSRPLAPRIFCR